MASTWKLIPDINAEQYKALDRKGYELLTALGTKDQDRYNVNSFRILEFLGDIFIRIREDFYHKELSLWRLHPKCQGFMDHWYVAHKITSPTGLIKSLFEPIAKEARMEAWEDVDEPDYPYDEIQTLMAIEQDGEVKVKVLQAEDLAKLQETKEVKTKYSWMKYLD